MARLPPGPIILSTVRTTLFSWVVLRAFVVSASKGLRSVMGVAADGPSLTMGATILLILGVAAIALIDMAVARERLLLANLGVSRRAIAGISLAMACALEILAVLVLPSLSGGG